MNRIQHWTLIGGLLLVFLAGLFPPETFVWRRTRDYVYVPYGRTFLLRPGGWTELRLWEGEYGMKRGYVRIDYYRLGLEWLTIASLTGVVFLITRKQGV